MLKCTTPERREQLSRLLRAIPTGQVSTYGDLARLMGIPRQARYIGYLLRTNPDPVRCPCYKVVASDGRLTGYSATGGLAKKRALLRRDGVALLSDDRVDLRRARWVPSLP